MVSLLAFNLLLDKNGIASCNHTYKNHFSTFSVHLSTFLFTRKSFDNVRITSVDSVKHNWSILDVLVVSEKRRIGC